MPQVINGIPLNDTEGFDKITSTDKITAGYFTGGDGKLEAVSIISGTLTDTQEKYYYAIAKDNVTGSVQFHVAYGHKAGSGSYTNSNAIEGATEAVYKQWANILQPETEVTGGFYISRNSGLTTAPTNAAVGSGADQEIWILTAQRSLMKDRLNKKNWTIALSGSKSNNSVGVLNRSGSGLKFFTDDSDTVQAVATPAGPRYNIVSGTLSGGTTINTEASDESSTTGTYGTFYPSLGIILLNPKRLQAAPLLMSTVSASNTDNRNDRVLYNTIKSGSYFQAKRQEQITSRHYFVRAAASQFNTTTNETYYTQSVSGVKKVIAGLAVDPKTYITTVGLYNSDSELLAIAKLSKPILKSKSREALIKVKLDF